MKPYEFWTDDGKIDDIKYVKIMAELNGTDELTEMKSLFDFLEIKYLDKIDGL